MNKKGVTGFLLNHSEENPVSFHMPGHKGSRIYKENGYGEFLDKIMDCDITEIKGADNLFQAESIIKETMEKYRELYNVEKTYLLINGSSAGLIAAIMTLTSKNDRLIIARNAHKSVFNGLTLAGAEPVYAYPELIENYGISGPITLDEVKRCIAKAPDAKGALIPSPNYYGVCSDIGAISDYLHSLGKVLIVDQAHGAHLPFFDTYTEEKKMSAEALGADIVINSTHKTLATFTQSAIVNICSTQIDKYLFEDKLQLIESTSPSYLLMASMDINADLLKNKKDELIASWKENLDYFYDAAKKIKGLRVMEHPMLDRSKLNLDMSDLGIDGLTLEKLLMEKNIYVELVTGNILMCMTGIGNKRYDYERLIAALEEISAAPRTVKADDFAPAQLVTMKRLEQRPLPQSKRAVAIEDAVGKVCAASIVPYPPGIPIICPGEVMDKEILDYVKKLREEGQKVIGVDQRSMVYIG